jgi:Rrf2 family protein
VDGFQLTKEIQYALKVLICLGATVGAPLSARQLARCLGIPATQSAKILHRLTWAGLVRSRRGSRGGYELRRDPEEIRAGEVARLFQLPGENGEAEKDPLQRVWQEVSAGCRQSWEGLTIAELARRVAAREHTYACLEELVQIHGT